MVIFRKFATESGPLIDIRIQFLFNSFRTNRLIETKFCKHIIIDKIYIGNVNGHFQQFATELQTLMDIRIQFLHIETKFCIHTIIDKIYVGIVNRHFLRVNGQNLTKFHIHTIIDKIYVL